MFKNALAYNWTDWFMGIMRSFLSGAASAFITGNAGAVLGIPQAQVIKLMVANFFFMGLYRMGEFLRLHGAPDPVVVAQVKTTTEIKPVDPNLPTTKTVTRTDVTTDAVSRSGEK